jgi:glycosyl transferase family 2
VGMPDLPDARVPEASIIVIAISSTAHIRRCLYALESQRDTDKCEIIVAADSRLGSLDDLAAEFSDVRFVSNLAATTPLTLTATALDSARGERVVLTEDSCVADPDWLVKLLATDWRGHAAVGGSVEAADEMSSAMWAFAYVDFFRYMRPVRAGSSASLSVCNVAYRAADLRTIRDRWRDGFHETNVHEVLSDRFGSLFLNPEAVVRVSRSVAPKDAVYERYAFGRLFGATRISDARASRRIALSILSIGLPFLLTARLALKSFSDARLLERFVRSLPFVLVLVLAWSWGEWLGYVTKSLPKRVTTAPEIPEQTGSRAAA